MMGKELDPETSIFNQLTLLIAREDFNNIFSNSQKMSSLVVWPCIGISSKSYCIATKFEFQPWITTASWVISLISVLLLIGMIRLKIQSCWVHIFDTSRHWQYHLCIQQLCSSETYFKSITLSGNVIPQLQISTHEYIYLLWKILNPFILCGHLAKTSTNSNNAKVVQVVESSTLFSVFCATLRHFLSQS
jgi:hypothetical protein